MPNELLIAADAFTANISHEARYFFGVSAPYHTPSLIVADGQEGPYGASTWGPWKMAASGQLFTLLENAFIFAGIYSSSDNGRTWVELDAANHIPSGVMTPFFDGDHTVIVAYRIAGAGQQQIRLKNFDLQTGKWGPVYADSGAPSCTALVTVVKRTDGTVFVGYDNSPPAPVPPASNFKGAVFSQASPGGAWTVTALDVGTNMAQLGGWIALTKILAVDACFAMDSNGTLHFVFANLSSNLFAYQAVKIDNTLGPFHQFTDNLDVFSGAPLGHPVIIGTKLVIPAVFLDGSNHHYQTLYTATPLSAPVFTVMPSPGIDPSESPNFLGLPDNVADLAYDPAAGILYALWPRENPVSSRNFAQLRLAQTSNADPTLGWSAQTIFDLDVDSPPGFDFVGQELQIPSAGIFAASASPVAVPPTSGGGPFVIPLPCKCDIDQLAAEEYMRRRDRKKDWPYRWRFPPPGAIRVTAGAGVAGTLIVPAAGVATEGLAYTVDEGYIFVLQKVVVVYLANGTKGPWSPGDAKWSLTLNQPVGITTFQGQTIQGFGSVDVPLGTLRLAFPLECPEILAPNDTLRSVFTNVNLNNGAPNYFKTLFLGWRWPVPAGIAV